jgi:hypothetical protein
MDCKGTGRPLRRDVGDLGGRGDEEPVQATNGNKVQSKGRGEASLPGSVE